MSKFKAKVLCEGKEDKVVFEKIAAQEGLADCLTFEQYNGKDSLAGFLKTFKARPEYTRKEFETLALTRDADDSFDSAWQSLTHAAKSAFDAELGGPGIATTIPDPDYPMDPTLRLVGWILPGPGQTGMLETLCLESVSGTPAHECLTQYFECLSQKTGTDRYHPKAKFHAWVVSHTDFRDKDYKIEKAVKEDRFQWDHPVFEGLRAFLRSLAA